MKIAAHKIRPVMHPQERLFVALTMLLLVFLPWAFGTIHPWSQWVAFGLSVAMFASALWPRYYSEELSPQGAFQLQSWPRLRRFPLFWIGAVFLFYVLVQALNPNWEWQKNETRWWLQKTDFISWLPTSVDAPWGRSNAWRLLVVYCTVWLTVCSLWIGVTRKRSLRLLLGTLVVSGVLLSVVGFAQKMIGTPKLLGLQSFPGSMSFSSFVYQNHAGAYFGVISFVALGLSVWTFFKARREMARSNPSLVWGLAALIMCFAVVFSTSRGAMGSLAIFGAAAIIAGIFLRMASPMRSTTNPLVTISVVFIMLATVGFVVLKVDFSPIRQKFTDLSRLGTEESSYSSRKQAGEAAMEMYADHWLRGVGSGGFRHLFPQYVKKKPEIYQGGRLFWAHAHNDWLEIPIELGLGGVLLILSAMSWVARSWWRHKGWRNPLTLMLAMGLGQTLLHALLDFPFQAPAILVTWWALLVISLRWLEFEDGESMQRMPTLVRENVS